MPNPHFICGFISAVCHFCMMYNYGAAILRAVGHTKRPLIFLIVSGVINAVLNLFLVIGFHLDVAGVGIATVISQLVSCILVLRCLHHTESSYQLHLAKLRIRSVYLKQIFEVGVPAGIQSTVINISNAMLQSSVNSFGSIAMAGYTASNNSFRILICVGELLHTGLYELHKPELRSEEIKTYGQGSDRLYDPFNCGNFDPRKQCVHIRTGTSAYLQ